MWLAPAVRLLFTYTMRTGLYYFPCASRPYKTSEEDATDIGLLEFAGDHSPNVLRAYGRPIGKAQGLYFYDLGDAGRESIETTLNMSLYLEPLIHVCAID